MSTTVLFVAALAIDLAAMLFFRATGVDPSNAPRIVAVMTATVVTVGAFVFVLHQRIGREQVQLVTDSSAALRAVATRAGLAISEPPPSTDGNVMSRGFVEARGQMGRFYVVITIEGTESDKIETVIRFPRSRVDPVLLKGLVSLVRDARDEGGLKLSMSRRPPLLAWMDYDRVPETDANQLQSVLDRAVELLTADAPVVPAPSPSR